MLDDTAVEVLGVAAAAGATLPEVLNDVCGVGADAVRATLDGLFATALLVPDGDEVRFRHELGREVFYDELVPGERARVHALLARSVAHRRPERLGDVARHWSAAHDTPRALAASVAAGRQALRTGAAAEAEGHLGRALELWARSRTPARWPGSIIPPCSSRPPSPPSTPGTSNGGSSSISELWPSWPASTRCVRPRCGSSYVISTGSWTVGTTARSLSPGPSSSSPSHHHRALGPRRWRTPRSARSSPTAPSRRWPTPAERSPSPKPLVTPTWLSRRTSPWWRRWARPATRKARSTSRSPT